MEQTFSEQLNALYELIKYCGIPPKQFDKVFKSAKNYQKILALDITATKLGYSPIEVISEIVKITGEDI